MTTRKNPGGRLAWCLSGTTSSAASTRRREVAIRRALGAGRLHLIRQMLTESVVLSVAGGVLAIFMTIWGVDILLGLTPANIPRLHEVSVDGRVLAFMIALALLTGLLFGIAPAVQMSRSGVRDHLQEGSLAAGGSLGANRLRGALVVVEFAIALVLLAGAGLLIRSFTELLSVNPGFAFRNVLVARIWLPQPNDPATGRYFEHAKRRAFLREVLRRVTALPGVQETGAITNVPLGGLAMGAGSGRANAAITIENRAPGSAEVAGAQTAIASPGYFRAMRIPLVSGRLLEDRDDQNAPAVTIVNVTLARRFWPGADPLGKRLKLGRQVSDAPWLTVVGVVGDVKTNGLDTDTPPQLYRSLMQVSNLSLTLVVRSASDPAVLANLVTREVRAVDPDLPVYGIKTGEQLISSAIAERRFSTVLLGVFASMALLLAAIGIYGVMAYSVSQRTREIGIRMALGARAHDVQRLVLGQGMALTAGGTVIGLIASSALTRMMASLLFGVSATDPVTFAGISLLLSCTALLVCYVPARRAARVNPIIALRYE